MSGNTGTKIKQGDKLPLDKISLKQLVDGKPVERTGHELFDNKKVALFTIPGAFTPSCSEKHLPNFIEKADELKAKGIKEIIAVVTNDAFVCRAWSKSAGADGKVTILADGDASFAHLLGIAVDTKEFGGNRISRLGAIVDNGVVTKLNLENGGDYTGLSSADQLLKDLSA